MVGQKVGKYLSGKIQKQSLVKIGNVNIFRGRLPVSDMVDITEGGSCGLDGDYLAWNTASWKLTGMYSKTYEVEQEDLCNQDERIGCSPRSFKLAG